MDDDRFERLLKGYRLPEVSPALDQRALSEGTAIMERARTLATVEAVGRSLLHQLGFGYIPWLIDLVTTADAEYRVVVI